MTKARLVVTLSLIAGALALALPASAPGAQDMFLKLDGIPGESQDQRHRDAIEVLSFSWGVTAGKQRAEFKDFAFTKRVDRASPQLFVHAARGQVIRAAVLSVRKAGERQGDFLEYCLTDVRVTGLSTSGGTGDDGPTEQVTLAYGTFFQTYRRQSPDGMLGATFTGGWNLVDNLLLGARPAAC